MSSRPVASHSPGGSPRPVAEGSVEPTRHLPRARRQPALEFQPGTVHPGLGRMGLLLVSVAAVLGALLALWLGHHVGTMMEHAGTSQVTTSQLESMFPRQYHELVWLSIAWVAVATMGLVGWVICFVALSRGSGRRLAGTGIALGVLALLVSGVAMLAGMLPHMHR